MRRFDRHLSVAFWLLLCAPLSLAQESGHDPTVTLLFTNDMESAYEPVPAFWLEDIDYIGGIAQLSTLIRQLRARESNVFLFDAGDIFTGSLSRLTEGALMFEFMISMGYDAMAIGNHEFDYGETVLAWQKNRAPFPVLGANLFYRGTGIPFARPHAILERNGVRIGVIGILGQDAASTAVAADHIDELDVTDPAEAVLRSVKELRDHVDLIVLLTHQGHTAPMQTDAEIDPRLARDIDKDIALAGAVPGIDVLFGGHADAGTPEPVINEKTGTLIMQTYGQATYLGFLQLTLDAESREIKAYDGRLIPVDAGKLQPDPVIEAKNARYRARFPEITEVIGYSEARLNRKYFDESDLGNLLADILVEATGADIGMMHPGGIRKDFPQGPIEVADVLDTNPFVDPVMVVELSGEQLFEVLEQSFSQLRGLMQVSGIETVYDTSRAVRQRLISVTREGRPIAADDRLTVAVSGIIARGGDHYATFRESTLLREYKPLAELTIEYFRKHESVAVPRGGRQTDLAMQVN
ncbi:MAG: bifunctional UDP-sugar hydrolase/5'-nucleotidase [Woeseiaceae bacterium]|nr:bifunctional UDP-sugar hydrolase/5'-nucleotidase [Woeseiaceae bacterium]